MTEMNECTLRQTYIHINIFVKCNMKSYEITNMILKLKHSFALHLFLILEIEQERYKQAN